MPIRTRLSLLFTLGAALLISLVTIGFLLALRSGLTSNLDATLTTRAAEVSAALRADPTAAIATETSSGILVQVLSASGQLKDGSDVLGNRPLITPQQANQVGTGPQAFDTQSGVTAGSDQGQEQLRVVALPGPPSTLIVAAVSRGSIDNAVQQAARELVVLDIVLVAAAAGGSWLLARAALRPVESLRRQAAELPTADAAAGIRIPPGRDELAHLASTFNDLLGRLGATVERERAFVADAGHELRTPLTVLKGELELAQRPGRTVRDMRQMVVVAAYEADRLIQLTEDLLGLARTTNGDGARFETVDVGALAHVAADALADAAADRDVELQVLTAPSLLAQAQPASLRRALDNLLTNALRYAPPGTDVRLRVRIDGDSTVVSVRDQGPGFPEAFLPQAFERFTTADETRHRDLDPAAGHGAGLGLAIVQAVMSQHNGYATAANHPDGGAVIELHWPTNRPEN